MNSTERVFSTTGKATLLSTCLFWVLFLSIEQHGGSEILLYVLISIIILFIISFLAVIITVMPFYLLEEKKLNSKEIFKKYFSYYSITIFSICLYFIIIEDFNDFIIIFCSTTFFTAIQSWIWFFKTTKNEKTKK